VPAEAAQASPPPAPPPGAGAEALLQHLEWTVLKRLDGLLQGDWRSAFRGRGVDLADLREYQLHDDVRHIDWNVTARLQVPHVRQYNEDRELCAWFLLDRSASMHFGSGALRKLDQATAFTGALARLFTQHGNRVGAVLYGRAVDAVLPPGASRRHVLNLLQRLQQPLPPTPPGQPSTTGTALADLLQAADGVLKRRSLVFVVSDFISQPGWAAPLARLARRHDVLAVRLVDPVEQRLPAMGLLTVQDAETGEQLFLDTSDPGLQARHAALVQAQDQALLQGLTTAGCDLLEVATDQPLLPALLRFADLRRQRARQPSPMRFPASLRRAAPAPVATAASATA
jgi:uncharacterized protein (DUF58 family)